MKLWKVQKFFGDVVYDLRSRRLLPLAIGLLVAIIAVPILISRGSSSSPPPTVSPAAASGETAPEIRDAVVSYDPGIRDYKRRLNDRSPKDPFQQQSPPSAEKAGQLSSTLVAPTSGGSGSATVSTGASGGGTTASGGSGSTQTTTTHRIYFFHSVADVSFGEVSQPLQRHKSLKTYAFLPNQMAPVLVYLGSTLDEKKALFSVSKYTDQLTGQGGCAPGPTDCSLLVLAPGETEDMVYAGDGKTYRVKVNSIQRKIVKPQG